MGEQSAVLPTGRCPVVFTVLRTLVRTVVLRGWRHDGYAVVLHPDGTERGVLQRLGNNPQGVEGLFTEDYSSSRLWHRSTDYLQLPATTDLNLFI